MATPDTDEAAGSRDPSALEGISDRSLLRRAQLGHGDASTEIYMRYAERLIALVAAQSSGDLARRAEPEDIVQSVFRTFFRRVNLGQYDVPNGEELWKLLLVIALNKVRARGSFHRAAKRDVRRTSGGESFDRAMESEAGRDNLALRFLQMAIEDVLRDLPEAHRKMIELRIEGHEVGEIATQVQRSKRSVERELQNFRARLKSLIDEEA
jgi:RNA polymerase sigma-70 factor (ECF subfamily)